MYTPSGRRHGKQKKRPCQNTGITERTQTQVLPMLDVGDRVMIQNQSGRFPKKWDKSGVVIEKKGNDQHVVKVDGSGRLTLRNRRFLRKYKPHGGNHHARVSDAYAQNVEDTPNRKIMSVAPDTVDTGSPGDQQQGPPVQSLDCPSALPYLTAIMDFDSNSSVV